MVRSLVEQFTHWNVERFGNGERRRDTGVDPGPVGAGDGLPEQATALRDVGQAQPDPLPHMLDGLHDES
jgi:hypothetical protein